MRAARLLPVVTALCLAGFPATGGASGAAQAMTPARVEAADRFDGSSGAAFADSLASFEAGMSDADKLGLHMKLAQVRAKLAEQRGRPLTDAEFATALDGKTLAELDTLADAAPTHITIDIETSNDT